MTNSVGYTWSVPGDVEGLRALFGSDANYTALLQTLMVNTPLWPTNALPNPWYWAGNEPGVLAPWQFSLVPGEEWRTQYWVRWVLDTYYTLTADGVSFGAPPEEKKNTSAPLQ